jgi:hypothetical protein
MYFIDGLCTIWALALTGQHTASTVLVLFFLKTLLTVIAT